MSAKNANLIDTKAELTELIKLKMEKAVSPVITKLKPNPGQLLFLYTVIGTACSTRAADI